MTVSDTPALTWSVLEARLAQAALWPIGGLYPAPGDDLPEGTGTLVLLAPREPGFWAEVTAEPEFSDGANDPLDRWSRRTVGRIACDVGGKALFPFTGPPWRPFMSWALRTGRIHQSPVGLLVHGEAGLFVSLRGALALRERLEIPAPSPSPCASCAARPCLEACPVSALTGEGYDLAACRGFLDSPSGTDCMQAGCAVRRACPVSARYPRLSAQSAFHMRAFHGAR